MSETGQVSGNVTADTRITGVVRAQASRIGGDVRAEPKISGNVRVS